MANLFGFSNLELIAASHLALSNFHGTNFVPDQGTLEFTRTPIISKWLSKAQKEQDIAISYLEQNDFHLTDSPSGLVGKTIAIHYGIREYKLMEVKIEDLTETPFGYDIKPRDGR